MHEPKIPVNLVRWVISVALVLALSACANTRNTTRIHDPYEAQNRKIHAFNVKVLGTGKGRVRNAVPPDVRLVIGNLAENLSMPQVAVNSLLQGDLRGVGLAVYRFTLNTLVGVGGIVDVADEIGVPEHDTDFGETLHVWGVGEGAYLKLPILGPTTQRDLAGRVADLLTNPLSGQFTTAGGYTVQAVGIAADQLEEPIGPATSSYEERRRRHLAKRRAELQD